MGLIAYLQARRIRRSFPRKKEKFWYCGEIFSYSCDLLKVGKPHKTKEMGLPCEKFLVNPYSGSGGGIPKEGDVIPCIKLDGWIGYYEVIGKERYASAGSDFAGWDDGYEIDLKFHHCEKEVVVM